jgi:hypothetical protein
MKTLGKNNGLIPPLVVVLLAGFVGLSPACSPKSIGDKVIKTGSALQPTKSTANVDPTKSPTPSPTPVIPMEAKNVMLKLREYCSTCHGTGKDKRSFWPMPVEFDLPLESELLAQNIDPAGKETFDKIISSNDLLEKLISKIESDQFSVEVFQSIENNLLGKMDGKPKGMPYMYKFSGAEAEDFKRILAWFQARLPFVVADARSKYHVKDSGIGLPVDYQYQCTSLVTTREFLNRLGQDALGRSLRAEELELFGKLDVPVTMEVREKAVGRLAAEWKNDFLSYGLKQFAEKVTSAGKIRQSQLIVDSQMKSDIAGEFYELVKYMVANGKSYRETLETNTVFATKKTALYYGKDCTDKVNLPENAGKTYVQCTMEAPRGTYFTTLGFLASKPSSMLFENNNYGRVAAMNEVIRGETLLPNTEGEQGTKVNDLPQCLVTNDWRVLVQSEGKFAPRGTAKIPATGNYCQGCHLGRQLASGSIVFRPFGPIGDILSGESLRRIENGGTELSRQEALLKSYILEAKSKLDINDKVIQGANNWANQPPGASELQRVDVAIFGDWLNIGLGSGQERGCVQDNGVDYPVVTVDDLLKYYLRDELVLARGLSRIVPRAMSNLNATNQEIISGVMGSWKSGGGKLLPVFQAYLKSETFSCAAGGQ